MNRLLIVISVAVFVGYLGLATSVTDAQDNAQIATGSIKGQITASGVRDTENVLVYVEKAPGAFPAPKDPATMDQQKLTFVPNVLPILKGTKVKFNNSDPVLHNVFWNKSADGAYEGRNLGTFGKGAVQTSRSTRKAPLPCSATFIRKWKGILWCCRIPIFPWRARTAVTRLRGCRPVSIRSKPGTPIRRNSRRRQRRRR